MTKVTITRIWVIGLIVLVAGLLVGGLGVGLMLAAGGTYEPAASGGLTSSRAWMASSG